MKTESMFCIVLLFMSGCSSRQKPLTAEPLSVETQTVALSPEVSISSYVGTVEETSSAALSFPLGGTIYKIFTDEGRHVRQGELLAELDATSAAQTYAAAEAALVQARDARDRLKQLYDAQSLPEIKWVEAVTRLQQAEASYEIAKKNLADCKLHAPFSGVIGRKIAAAGETVLPGTPVMTLLDIRSVKVRFAVPEQEIAAIRPDSKLEMSVAALGDRQFYPAGIEKGAEANAVAHSYDVRAMIENPGRTLLPGMVCRVTVLDTLPAGCIVIPARAVQQGGDARRFVWLVRDGIAIRRNITTGKLVDNNIVVTGGLEEGNRIVVKGTQKIGEGTKIVVK